MLKYGTDNTFIDSSFESGVKRMPKDIKDLVAFAVTFLMWSDHLRWELINTPRYLITDLIDKITYGY